MMPATTTTRTCELCEGTFPEAMVCGTDAGLDLCDGCMESDGWRYNYDD